MSNDKDRNRRNNTYIRTIVTDPELSPLRVIREQGDGILIVAVDVTRSRKKLKKALQYICKTYRVPNKDLDARVVRAIQLIRNGQARSISKAADLAGVPDWKVRYAVKGLEVSNA